MDLLTAFALQPTLDNCSKHALLQEFYRLDKQSEKLVNDYANDIKEYREIELNLLFLKARAKVILKLLNII